MTIRRTVPNIKSEDFEGNRKFYNDFLGLEVAMEMDEIITFASSNNRTAQVSVLRKNETVGIHPDISVEVNDVEEALAKAEEQNIEIVYPIRDEPWGVRRFFVKDPNGKVVNILSHL